jgi:Polyketide cyclase / dehydrase and lipid transport/Domain of unknown function (DUF4331)
MSDHVDGPRSIGEPASDLTDLFAFTSPADRSRTVLAANVFPSAGANALFSNVVNHALVVRRASLAGSGNATRFAIDDQEYRFSCRFDALDPALGDAKPIQHGTCSFPDGQSVRFVVNNEQGTATPDGKYRVFAGLRSDPFFLAWMPATLKKIPNLLQHDNVLCILVEFDTQRVLGPQRGSLFAVVAETTPLPHPGGFIGHDPPRFDWVGRPEQTNLRLNNPALAGTDDLRDLWNQQKPFSIAPELRPVFRKRMLESLTNWDMRDSRADWTPVALAANAEMFLDDFILFDVAKPITDESFLEIEKSTLDGKPYQTGGGRTVNSNVIDVLLTWMVNHDRERLEGGALSATQRGGSTFPYLAAPNTQLQTVVETVDLPASPGKVWEVIGDFGARWNPLIASIQLTGKGIGQLRTIETIDGKQMVERLESIEPSKHHYRYTMVSGIQAANYVGELEVQPRGTGSSVTWRVQYLPNGQADLVIRIVVSTLAKTGLEALKQRLGPTK